MPQTFLKDPSSVLDYIIDWSTWLAGVSPNDTILTSTWAADTGITIDSDSNTTTTATVFLSSGTARNEYKVTNTIVTAGSRTAERTIYIHVIDR